MQRNTARTASIALGIFMAVVLVAGAILPLFTQNQTVTVQPTVPPPPPTPTFPPAVTNFDGISFAQRYLHPTGLYTIALPTGFSIAQPLTQQTTAQVNMRNETTLAVIDAFVYAPQPTVTPDQLSGLFNEEALRQTWSRFPSAEETNRSVENDRLIIDFAVQFRNQNYVARQEVWTDGEWIYAVRVLTPDNAVSYLRFLLDNMRQTIEPLNLFPGTPFGWQVTYDNLTQGIIRHPEDWAVTDGGPGRPTTLTNADGDTLRLESRAGTTVTDEDAARAFVESLQSGAQIASVTPVTRGTSSGFAVAYNDTTLDGDPFSGLAVLLNQTDTLLSANLRFGIADADLNSVAPVIADASAPDAEATETPLLPGAVEGFTPDDVIQDARLPVLAAMMNTFQTIAPLNLAPETLSATPTPLPTITPTPQATLPIVETTAEATAETTPEAEATAEAPETTPEAGS
jgi:hypothetical protein